MTWKRYAAAVAVLIVAERFAGEAGALVVVALNIAPIAAVHIGVRRHRPADRLTWRLIMASLSMFLIGNVTLFVSQDVFGNYAYPGPADAAFVLQFGALITAAVRVVRARTGRGGDLYGVLDAVVVAAGVSLVCWRFWIAESVAGSMPLPTRAIVIAYPIFDLVLFGLAMRALLARGAKPVALRLFASTLLLLFVTDVLYGWQVTRGVYEPHNWLDVLWNGCFLLTGTLALHPSMASMTDRVRFESELPRSNRWHLVAMACAAALAPAMLALNGLGDGDLTEISIAIGALVMFAGVILRAHLAAQGHARANAALLRKQDELAAAMEALRATEQERRQLLDGVIRAGEQERVWVAAELHDGPIQQLSALGFGIDRVRRRIATGEVHEGARALEEWRDELTRVVGGLRKLMSELRPPALDESGLEGALRDYVAAFRRDSGIQCSFAVSLGDERLPAEVETTLYRVAQEALLNVRRHSRARHVSVSLVQVTGGVRLRVHDDGDGFDVSRPSSEDHAHYGLIGMRERVEQRGGVWRVQSSADRGTTIDAEVPVQVPVRTVLVEVAS